MLCPVRKSRCFNSYRSNQFLDLEGGPERHSAPGAPHDQAQSHLVLSVRRTRSAGSESLMAETTKVAAKAAKAPTRADLDRASDFAREPFLLEGEKLKDLTAGSPRRRALDAALGEIDAGHETPSIEWRRDYSLMLGLERLLAEEPPVLKDGAELNDHQVDALSGTLAALISELEESNGKSNGSSNGSAKASG